MTSKIPENLYHVLLTTTHINKNPNNIIETLRIPGTYTSLLAAKAAAHSCLYDAGYERDFFPTYETSHAIFEKENLPDRLGLAIYAVAPDGTTFRVRIDTTPNKLQLTTDLDDGRVSIPLYYVVQANVEYDAIEGQSTVREVIVQSTFTEYLQGREYARSVLLSEQDGILKGSYAAYVEAGEEERDCGYGENVVVHASSDYGVNHLVSVIRNQELGSVILAEAAMRIG
ncbi:hypothetical protein BO94DRAFT_539283 [Aspergillus sclerotioniger CBS 115572]|uniref:Uncharacterized protein n=1 Tax=Aspergillus sclerotioniger CBS 115572 TaxID=1450535 RepID=A0A317VFC0_9EURO|nr:hypothetical protein BO94DRAFT_539283 [Aspergillus sclerotioniger CBS 115572]PWY72159.1 hypothetical protein BO94DRAFT_539283 [Aspergillus sclerotioniger CBS 115572]